MLTNKQIEEQDYSTNDVADLKMRLDIAIESLSAIAGAIEHDQPYRVYEWATNDYSRITGEHNHNCDGDVSLDKGGNFQCQCLLVASAELSPNLNKELKNGWVKLQVNPERVVCLDGSNWHGWLWMRHVDGQLVSLRKLEDWEIMQAEDQRDEDIVIDGGHNVISKSGGMRCG